MFSNLSETVTIKTVSEDSSSGVFEIEGLYTGYGITLGNALRRVLLSSLPGAAVTRVKIKNIAHEFSTLPGMTEDVVELTLNLKKVRFLLHTNESQTVSLKVKGIKDVTGADIETNAQVEVVNPQIHIVSLTAKNADLDMELTIERGLGYVPVEASKTEKLPIGTIALDAIYSPVMRTNFEVENMRVGDRTNYNRLRIYITTDGSISPSAALKRATEILQEHFGKSGQLEVKEMAQPPLVKAPDAKPAKAKKAATKTKKK